MMFCLLLVVIDQVDVVCVTFFKAESDPPVSGNRDTPANNKPHSGIYSSPKTRSINQPNPKSPIEGRHHQDDRPLIGLPAEPRDQGKDERDDGYLTDFHAGVECKQRGDQPLGRQPQLAQHIGEAKPMHQPKGKGDYPAVFHALEPKVFRRDVHDAQGNASLDPLTRQADDFKGRQAEGDAVGNGEGRYYLDQTEQPSPHHNQRQQKHDVVVAEENVLHPRAP